MLPYLPNFSELLPGHYRRCASGASDAVRWQSSDISAIIEAAAAHTSMLFFELFPAFMLIVTILAGIGLFVMERRAGHEGSEHTGASVALGDDSDSTRPS